MSDRASIRTKAAQFIVNCEARRDRAGNLRVYKLPASDGGGTFEVAGINDGYHPAQANFLRDLIRAKDYKGAESYACGYIARYTDTVLRWVSDAALEVFLRDCCFNRGPKGALRILQIAMSVADDGKFGPITKAAVKRAEASPGFTLTKLRASRETYERRIAPPVGDRARMWPGLVNRWDKASDFAASFLSLNSEAGKLRS